MITKEQARAVIAAAKASGGPAFPSHGSMGEVVQEGMTLRDYFAAAAMQRIHAADENGMMGPEITATAAYMMADCMLAEREKK